MLSPLALDRTPAHAPRVNVAVFSTRPYDRTHLESANKDAGHTFTWIEDALSADNTALAAGHDAVCAFVNDRLDAPVLSALSAGGTRLVALRCAGYNHVDLATAASLGLTVTHVPAYSPHAVAEHAIALLLTLNRRTHLAHARVRRGDFRLDGLQGFDLHGKTAGLVGTGRIGAITGKILQGFGCRVLAYDPYPPREVRDAFEFVSLDELLVRSDIVSLHCPLLPATKHILNASTFARLKSSALVINTSRGGLIDTASAADALEAGRLGGLGLDVYEHEAELFFDDHSAEGRVPDPLLARLLALPNVVVTGHQGFLTREALDNIAASVVGSLDAFAAGRTCPHALPPR